MVQIQVLPTGFYVKGVVNCGRREQKTYASKAMRMLEKQLV
jgi:hypothetical protein